MLLGGARSGKSDLAVRLGAGFDGPVVFVATAEAGDDDMATRIDRHRAERPAWPTVESPLFGAAEVEEAQDDALLLVDCMTLLVSNLLLAERPIADHVRALGAALAERTGPAVVISNEVGMGIHPETPLGRAYRDELGRANRLLAEAADEAYLIVAGRALTLQPVEAPLAPAVPPR